MKLLAYALAVGLAILIVGGTSYAAIGSPVNGETVDKSLASSVETTIVADSTFCGKDKDKETDEGKEDSKGKKGSSIENNR
jgi:hypothetical protein